MGVKLEWLWGKAQAAGTGRKVIPSPLKAHYSLDARKETVKGSKEIVKGLKWYVMND